MVFLDGPKGLLLMQECVLFIVFCKIYNIKMSAKKSYQAMYNVSIMFVRFCLKSSMFEVWKVLFKQTNWEIKKNLFIFQYILLYIGVIGDDFFVKLMITTPDPLSSLVITMSLLRLSWLIAKLLIKVTSYSQRFEYSSGI